MRLFFLLLLALAVISGAMAKGECCHACGAGPFQKISSHYEYCQQADEFVETGFAHNLQEDARRAAREAARERALREDARRQREARAREEAERRARREV